ncbi:MAG: hypothetical protein O2854_07335 [Chloroflexi bacterium]|nr:hypothetical protein [Chloroflexota bacterium]
MNMKFWGESVAAQMPEDVRHVLESKFHIPTRMMAELRSFEKSGHFGGNMVDYIRIANADKIGKSRKYGDLDMYMNAVLYDGFRDSKGAIYLKERNAKSKGPAVVASARQAS